MLAMGVLFRWMIQQGGRRKAARAFRPCFHKFSFLIRHFASLSGGFRNP